MYPLYSTTRLPCRERDADKADRERSRSVRESDGKEAQAAAAMEEDAAGEQQPPAAGAAAAGGGAANGAAKEDKKEVGIGESVRACGK